MTRPTPSAVPSLRRLLVACAALLALCVLPRAARTQEVQVPIDSAGRVEVLDARLAARLGVLVNEYPGMREARLFRGPDGYVLEVTGTRDGRTARWRVPMTVEQVAELRARVSARSREMEPRAGLNQEGRYLLLAQSTFLGFTFYGVAVPYVLGYDDGSDGSKAASLYLLTAGASFAVPYALTERKTVTYGMANLSRYGASRGVAHGYMLYHAVAGGTEDGGSRVVMEPGSDVVIVEEDRDDDERERLATALVSSVAEGVGGYYWARGERMTAGTANAIALGGDFGLVGGLAGAYLMGGEDEAERRVSLMGLGGSVAGIVAGRKLAARREYTWGDVDMMYTAGALGAAGTATAGWIAGLEDRPLVIAGMVGAAGGLVVGDRLVAETDFSVSQAALNRLGTGAGAIIGVGVGILTDDAKATAALGVGGAALGYAATYAGLAPSARQRTGESIAVRDLRVRLSPEGVLGLAARDRLKEETQLPLLSVEYRF